MTFWWASSPTRRSLVLDAFPPLTSNGAEPGGGGGGWSSVATSIGMLSLLDLLRCSRSGIIFILTALSVSRDNNDCPGKEECGPKFPAA